MSARIIFRFLFWVSFFGNAADKLPHLQNSKKEPLSYKKQVIFFPITTDQPKILTDSLFWRRYRCALALVKELSETIPAMNFIEGVSDEAQAFVQKGINDFELHYGVGLNKPSKKLKLLLCNFRFWIFTVFCLSCKIYLFFYKRVPFAFCATSFLVALALVGLVFFKFLCPCQIERFWGKSILEDDLLQIPKQFCLIDYVWSNIKLFTHPLQTPLTRKQIITAFESQLQSTFLALAQLKQPEPTYTICPMPIFLNSLPSMSLEFEKKILIVSCFGYINAEFIFGRMRKNQAMKLFTEKQKILWIEYRKLMNYHLGDNPGCYLNDQPVERIGDEDDAEYFDRLFLKSEFQDLHAVLYLRSAEPVLSCFKENLLQLTYNKKAHFIDFNLTYSSGSHHDFSSIINDYRFFDKPSNTVPLLG